MLSLQPVRLVESTGASPSALMGAGARRPFCGAVGEEVLQAETTREATATTARVRWRRDMCGSEVGSGFE